eukprot:scpid3685/ scgid35315/ 
MDDSELSVVLVNVDDSEKNKILNVESVDDSASTLVAAFGGAWSGTYDVKVISSSLGTFDTSIQLDVSGTVSDFQPRTGSIYGGNKITVTGINFSANELDNPVNIAWDHCDVLSAEVDEIVARAPLRSDPVEDTDNFFIVGLKTSEEATCVSCNYEYLDSATPSLSSVTQNYDVDTGIFTLTFAGSGFGSEAEVFIDGVEQQIDTVSDTSVVATVTFLKSSTPSSVDFIAETGRTQTPADLLANNAEAFTFAPDLHSIVSSTGSTGGGVITLFAPGVGRDIDISTLNV